ncbi:MAG: hypothetical protein KF784_06060 [Fimbriimonadaceae bacterium]|nr:hypothetical protein [Fimbriimonadaceae bacterium]
MIQRQGEWWYQGSSISEGTEDFDLAFWQAQPAEAIFAAAWELVETACVIKGGDPAELRLQRTVGAFGPIPS